jgi:LysM repeat protein
MIGWMLLAMLLLPTLGAILARLIGRRAGGAARIAGGLAFAAAIALAIVLSRAPTDAAALGRMAIFLPSNDVMIARESFIESPVADAPAPAIEPVIAQITPEPTQAPRESATPAPTQTTRPTATTQPTPTATPEPTAEPTATPEPTAEPEPEPTSVPPTAAPAQADAPQRYIVEAGDTLRSIAERFSISVTRLLEYNGLTPEEGDSLRIDQQLWIPPR